MKEANRYAERAIRSRPEAVGIDTLHGVMLSNARHFTFRYGCEVST